MKCYKVLNEVANWETSESTSCSQYSDRSDAILAEPRTPEEFTAIGNLMQAQGIIWGWLGVSDLAIEGEFVYASDGLPYFGNVGNFDNFGGVEHCVMLYGYNGMTNYLGNDANCGSVGNPICQYETIEVV
jgi:hypothetical protein